MSILLHRRSEKTRRYSNKIVSLIHVAAGPYSIWMRLLYYTKVLADLRSSQEVVTNVENRYDFLLCQVPFVGATVLRDDGS